MDYDASKQALINVYEFQIKELNEHIAILETTIESLHKESAMTEVYGDPDFEKAVGEVLAMHRRKGADYGKETDFFANVSASVDWGISPWVGAMMRANDKIVRLQSAAQGSTLQNEGIEDSIIDIATYSVIALCLFRREVEGYYD